MEDRITRLLASKRDLAVAVLGGQGEAALTDLSDDELTDLAPCTPPRTTGAAD